MLDRNGYRVLTAATGRDAVDIVTGQQGHIDVPVTPNDGELRSGLGGQAPASACRDRMATEIR